MGEKNKIKYKKVICNGLKNKEENGKELVLIRA